MDRHTLEIELKKLGVSLNGWLPVLQCDVCKERWEPFIVDADSSTRTAKPDYWKCPNKCNSKTQVSHQVQTAVPKYLVINDIQGMIFSDDDVPEFRRYVRSMDATEIPNRGG